MNVLAKSAVLVLSLFLSGCAHQSGYYSGHSNFGAVGISVDAQIPLHAYSRHYDHDVYWPRAVWRKQRYNRSHYDGRRYDRSYRYGNKHRSKRRYDKHDHSHSQYKRKKRRNDRWGGRPSRRDYDRHR